MILYYLKLAYRNLLKNKLYSFINLFGLVCGTLSAFLIAKYLGGSLDYDSFHENKEAIYLTYQSESVNDQPEKVTDYTYWGLGNIIRDRYPEAEALTRYSTHVESTVSVKNDRGEFISYNENGIFMTDSSFFTVFTFPLKYGNGATALKKANSVVLTESIAKKYFRDENPVGQILTIKTPWSEETTFEVTGLAEDLPSRSKFRFDFLITKQPLGAEDHWSIPEYQTYLLLNDGVDEVQLSQKLNSDLENSSPFESSERKVSIDVTPFANSSLTKTEYLILAVGVFILFVSWINFINMLIAQSYARFKEIGVLKVLGSSHSNLILQFFFESVLINGAVFLITIGLYVVAEPIVQSLTNNHLLPLFNDPTGLNYLLVIPFVIGTILSAMIPSAVLKSQNLSNSLKKGYTGKIGIVGLRQSLVIVQFSIALVLIIGILVISEQLEYLSEKDKGINIENTLIVKAPKDEWENKAQRLEVFKQRCQELPYVSEISSSTTIPSEEYRREAYLKIPNRDEEVMVHLNGIDENFIDVYDVDLKFGKNYSPDTYWKNRRSVILSEASVLELGFTDPQEIIGKRVKLTSGKKPYEVIGVVGDYHKTSLKYEIKPMAFLYNTNRGHISIKTAVSGTATSESNESEQLAALQQIWDEVYVNETFDYFFLEEQYEAQNGEDIYFGKVFRFFTGMSIVIACLGLFSLSYLISHKRSREIGVRKVFGATSQSVLFTLMKGYFGQLLLSILIGTPAAIFLMNNWLTNYAYRIDVTATPIVIAIVSSSLIFLLTVSYHTLKASSQNPVYSLKDE